LHITQGSHIIRAKTWVYVVRNQRNIQGVRRLLLIQLSVTLLGAVGCMVFLGATAGISVMLGGVVSMVPNAYFAKRLFRYQGAQAARKIVKSFYQGEALKIAIAIALFAFIFKFCTIIPWLFFAAYITAQLMLWFTPIMFA
jgi:ATP synthase protein I